MSEYLSLSDVAGKYDISQRTIYNWTHTGIKGIKLPFSSVGGAVRIKVADLKQFNEKILNKKNKKEKQNNAGTNQN